jgi:hypothetical protein
VKRIKDWLFFLAMAPAWLAIVRVDELDEARAMANGERQETDGPWGDL